MVLVSIENDAERVLLYDLETLSAMEPQELTGPSGFWYPEPPEDVENWTDWANYHYYSTVLTDPLDMPLETRYYLLGTWSAGGSYCLMPDGVELNGEYLDVHGRHILTLKQNLTVYPVSGDNLFYTYDDEVTIPEGTSVRIIATNGIREIFFLVDSPVDGLPPEVDETGWYFALTVDDPETWPRTFDGIAEMDLFDGILYAG